MKACSLSIYNHLEHVHRIDPDEGEKRVYVCLESGSGPGRILYTLMKERHLKPSPSSISRISTFVDYINQSPAKSFTIEELCRVGQMQKSYLIDNFKMFTGYTPIQYVTVLKLEKGKDLLAGSIIPIKHIDIQSIAHCTRHVGASYTPKKMIV